MSVRARFWLVTLAALATALLTARLGMWQLSRAAAKTGLQAALEQQAQRPVVSAPAALPDDAQQAALLYHRRVQLAGHWSAPHTVYLDNRQMNGRPGFFVVTPLLLADGRALLVQRGWVPRDARERTRLPALALPPGEVAVTGRIAPPPARLFEFDSAASGPIRQNLDLEAFARETGLRLPPLSVLQSATAGAEEPLQRDWPAPATGVGKHYGYAIQWFALSALVVILYVWFQFVQPRRSRR